MLGLTMIIFPLLISLLRGYMIGLGEDLWTPNKLVCTVLVLLINGAAEYLQASLLFEHLLT